MKTTLIVFGGGAVADEVITYSESDRDIINAVLRYDDRYPDGKEGFISKSDLDNEKRKADVDYIVGYVAAVGSGALRRELSILAESYKFIPLTILQPIIQISLNCEVGAGSIIAPGAYIGIRSKLGKSCLINYHAVISHDCQLGDFVTVAPNATLCGGVKVKDGAYIGAGAIVRDSHITIGENSIVGCGAVVLQDVPNNEVVIGVPAKPLRK
jgi:sugar O-acyltransferase (sialic acid O-acetyltransferase NeuD family)